MERDGKNRVGRPEFGSFFEFCNRIMSMCVCFAALPANEPGGSSWYCVGFRHNLWQETRSSSTAVTHEV